MCINLTHVHIQHEADCALKKARLLQTQRQEEYEKAKVSTSRLEEEQVGGTGGAVGAKQLEKRRRLEEEALQKVQHLFYGAYGLESIIAIFFYPSWSHQQLCVKKLRPFLIIFIKTESSVVIIIDPMVLLLPG